MFAATIIARSRACAISFIAIVTEGGLLKAISAKAGSLHVCDWEVCLGLSLSHESSDVAIAVGSGPRTVENIDDLGAGSKAPWNGEFVFAARGSLIGETSNDLNTIWTLTSTHGGIIDVKLLRVFCNVSRVGENGVIAESVQSCSQVVQWRIGGVASSPKVLTVVWGEAAVQEVLLTLVD